MIPLIIEIKEKMMWSEMFYSKHHFGLIEIERLMRGSYRKVEDHSLKKRKRDSSN